MLTGSSDPDLGATSELLLLDLVVCFVSSCCTTLALILISLPLKAQAGWQTVLTSTQGPGLSRVMVLSHSLPHKNLYTGSSLVYKIFTPPLLGHSFTFQCSVWHICVQTVNIWTEVCRVTSRVRMNLAWVMMTYSFKKFKRQSEKKIRNRGMPSLPGEPVTFSHQLQEFVAASQPSCPGHSPCVLTWSLPWACSLCSTAKLWAPRAVPPFLFLSAGSLQLIIPSFPTHLGLLLSLPSSSLLGAAHKGSAH